MTEKPWFDQETDVLLIDEYIVEMDSYKRIVEDGKITDTELLEQTLERVMNLRRGCRPPAEERGKRTPRSGAPPQWRAASHNPSPIAESAMPTRNPAPPPTSSARARSRAWTPRA